MVDLWGFDRGMSLLVHSRQVMTMAARNRRITAVVEKPLYRRIKQAARAEGLSLSAKVRDLLREAIELDEDAYWVREGEKRLATWDDSKALTYEQVWGTDGG